MNWTCCLGGSLPAGNSYYSIRIVYLDHPVRVSNRLPDYHKGYPLDTSWMVVSYLQLRDRLASVGIGATVRHRKEARLVMPFGQGWRSTVKEIRL